MALILVLTGVGSVCGGNTHVNDAARKLALPGVAVETRAVGRAGIGLVDV